MDSAKNELTPNTWARGFLEQLNCIGKGGMSEIFKAYQPSLDRYVVVKKLRDELKSNSETVERFRREARALASVLHQNVAHVYDFIESNGESYILMEYIEGLDLSSVIEKTGRLPVDVSAAILLGVAKGISYIHAHNLIHRDIKPSNIRLTTRGDVKLMDFGIVMDTENGGLTRPGIMVGSPNYLSPEQILGDAITPKADIFLLGICLYEMVTGTRPFKEDANKTVFQSIREGNYIPVRKMQGSVPNSIDSIIRKCLQQNPNSRYGRVKDLILDLEVFLGAFRSSHCEDIILKFLDHEALLSASVPYYNEIAQKKRFRVGWLGLLLLSALVFAVGFNLGGLMASAPPSQPPIHFQR